MPAGKLNCPFPLPMLPHPVRNMPQPEVPGIVVEVVVAVLKVVVVLDSKQVPLMLGFCCLQSFTKPRQAFRCAAFSFRQAFFSDFVPVHDLLFGTRARQFLMSCLQSLRQWLGFAATPPASMRTKPSVASARVSRGSTRRPMMRDSCQRLRGGSPGGRDGRDGPTGGSSSLDGNATPGVV